MSKVDANKGDTIKDMQWTGHECREYNNIKLKTRNSIPTNEGVKLKNSQGYDKRRETILRQIEDRTTEMRLKFVISFAQKRNQ